MIFRSVLILLLSFSVCTSELNGQLSFTNVIEGQYGKLPQETVDPFPSIYDRLVIDYRQKYWNASATIEQFHTRFSGRSYVDLSQVRFQFKKNAWDIKFGNFYETLGRGMMLRAFEIPGAILEDIGFRSRTYFHRDILGSSIKYESKKFSVHVMGGGVLNNVFPPTFGRTNRRVDIIGATALKYKLFKGQEIGLNMMRRSQIDSPADYHVGLSLAGRIIKGLSYYLEYADIVDREGHAFYSGLTANKGAASLSLEYKNYKNFILGAGINEPPAGVKQQTYRVLNRSIHVPNPLNEEGIQADLLIRLNDRSTLNLNHALAQNKFGFIDATFRQYFVELQSSIGDNYDFKAFGDYSKDPFKGEANRYSAGLYSDLLLSEQVAFIHEIEYQSIDRSGERINNFNMLGGLNIHSSLSISILGEATNDPFLLSESSTQKIYLGANVRYMPDASNTFQFFGGQRRGGPACSAGVCYEILDFKGIELRWIRRYRAKPKPKKQLNQ